MIHSRYIPTECVGHNTGFTPIKFKSKDIFRSNLFVEKINDTNQLTIEIFFDQLENLIIAQKNKNLK